jgi:hypothetical protein
VVAQDKVLCACGCGTEFESFDKWGYRRRFVNGHGCRGIRRSAETRAKMAAAGQGRHLSTETRAKIAATLTGRKSSAETRSRISGANNHSWKGGRYIDPLGYVQVYAPDHPRQSNRRVHEHVLVYEAANGPIPKGFDVHHKNENRQDNRLENLELMTRAGHASLHRRLTNERRNNNGINGNTGNGDQCGG